MINLIKRLSIGVSFGLISDKELCAIITRYSDYIHDLFFSPTEGVRYLTRRRIYDFNNSTNEKRRTMLARVLEIAEKHNIKTSLTLNTPNIDIDEALAVFYDYRNIYHFDYLTTTSNIATVVKKQFSDVRMICSYNEAIVNYDKLYRTVESDLFDGIVLGGKWIRDKKAFDIVKEKGKEIKAILLVNNGCTHSCNSFCRSTENDCCLNTFNNELYKDGVEQMYSKQSVFPEELIWYEKYGFNIDLFKLSSRPITYCEFDNLLSSYTSLESKSYISNDVNNYHLYARLGYFGKYYGSLDYERIFAQKKELWKFYM